MTLAQVVYQLSTDSEFAARMRTDPEGALAEKGLQLSNEEKAFLAYGLRRSLHADGSPVSIQEVASLYLGWR
ncbi:MAG: hypothetical protein NZ840_09775 [Anaerolineales bacterium]|nr:hypothetical protein [Anaerolineales bacterium]MDW8162330.1 hypothetical protein [Anaerolineales bacterium]